MIESHPTLSVFGTTVLSTFPLILVVGREPNNNLPIAPGIGPYDFRLAPRCGFWNISYSAVARTLDMSTRQLKALCVERCGSPIVYADALPISLPDHVTNKDKYRRKVIEDRPRLEAHIRAIFGHHELT
ncbi:MAG: hypothetical protein EOM24_30230, partial [Chloroflexia bacterium]|nr:hypothetical protein [Chloroflexia bacterium]